MSRWLISGASRGIGLEMTRQLLARGEQVWAGARDPAALPSAEGLTPLALDVADSVSVADARAAFGDGPLDVLVNNAGTIGPGRQSATDMDFDGFARTLEVNTLGPLRLTQAFLPNLRASRGAKVVTVTSRMGSMSYAKSDRLAYRASKAAANKVMQALATDLEAEGIAAVALHPGWVRTDMGGPAADVGVEESAAGLIAVIEALDLKGTGRFLDYRGEAVDW